VDRLYVDRYRGGKKKQAAGITRLAAVRANVACSP
jgi:hypothetical protein